MTQPTDRPAEHCGHQPDHVIGQPTECVLRPGHSGSHADHRGMRWWLADLGDAPMNQDSTPTRPGIDHITSDQLDQLYARGDTYRDAWHTARDRARKERRRAERAEATLTAVRALHERDPEADYCDVCSNHGDITWPCATIAALDQHDQTTA